MTSTSTTPRPNILLITSEDTGKDLSCYGQTNVKTPHFDTLAARGARFDNAYVTQAVCSPGRASILTGLYPHQNGQIGLASHRFSMFAAFPTIPTLLKNAGYRTGRIGKLHVLPETAFEFDWVWNPRDHQSFAQRDQPATAQAAATFIAQTKDDDEPFFLMANYSDAHLPWIDQSHGLPETPLTADDVTVPPAIGVTSPRLRAQAASYYNCVSRLDSGVGMLLAELEKSGKADNTLVIYITDHGPQFSRGKGAIYEQAICAPLIIHWPGVSQPETVRNEFASQIDILPTILDAAGLPPLPDMPGRSLRPLMTGQPSQPVHDWPQYLFAQWNVSHVNPQPGLLYPQRSVRDERFKLILTMLPDQPNPVEAYYTTHRRVDSGCTQEEINAAPQEVQRAYAKWRQPAELELYDLQSDPYEFHDLASDPAHADTRDHLLSVLQQWQRDTHDALANPDNLQRFVKENEYVASLPQDQYKSPDFNWPYLTYLAGPHASRVKAQA